MLVATLLMFNFVSARPMPEVQLENQNMLDVGIEGQDSASNGAAASTETAAPETANNALREERHDEDVWSHAKIQVQVENNADHIDVATAGNTSVVEADGEPVIAKGHVRRHEHHANLFMEIHAT